MVSDLGGAQMSTLLESLPGIANVLRSPVADALVNIIRAAAGRGEFALADVDELINYATRRGLVAEDEGERVLEEVREAAERKAVRASERAKAKKAKAVGRKPKAAKKSKPIRVKKAAKTKRAKKAVKQPKKKR